jgi:hypothetical protein
MGNFVGIAERMTLARGSGDKVFSLRMSKFLGVL